MEYTFPFEKLEVWQLSRKLNYNINDILKQFPAEERFNLTNQIRRAATSVALNLAEGTSRVSFKEQARFSEVAFASLIEVYCALILAKDLGYLTDETFQSVAPQIREISNKINSLRNHQLSRVNSETNLQ